MKTYNTSEIAKQFNIHSNTVRFYEKIELLPKIPRKLNGYRVYNEAHVKQLKLIIIGLRSEFLTNNLRKQIINIIKTSAMGEYDKALILAKDYMESIIIEKNNAEDAIRIVEENILDVKTNNSKTYTRKQLSDYIGLTIDTLRNWELNGLLRIKRKSNGYRIYNEDDIKKIKIIRALRCSNFSLSAILRLLQELEKNKDISIKEVINTPNSNEDIISACDKLLTSLSNAQDVCDKIIKQIKIIKKINPPI